MLIHLSPTQLRTTQTKSDIDIQVFRLQDPNNELQVANSSGRYPDVDTFFVFSSLEWCTMLPHRRGLSDSKHDPGFGEHGTPEFPLFSVLFWSFCIHVLGFGADISNPANPGYASSLIAGLLNSAGCQEDTYVPRGHPENIRSNPKCPASQIWAANIQWSFVQRNTCVFMLVIVDQRWIVKMLLVDT